MTAEHMGQEDLLRFVDVGALGGLDSDFTGVRNIWPVLFEPNATEAEKLRSQSVGFERYTVVECALGDCDRATEFRLTRNPTCSSILEPNFEYLKQYGIAYHFAVSGKEKVEVKRYDSLYQASVVPEPDVIKIDVQGFEWQVLAGFGDLLSNVLAIKLEAHYYPVYQGQKLLGEIVEFLAQFGLRLRLTDMNKVENFAGDLVEVDAYFSKDRRAIRALSTRALDKFNLVSERWRLPSYDFGLP